MKRAFISWLAALALFAPLPVFAQSTTLDQIPAPCRSASNTNLNSEVITQAITVTGGTLYVSAACPAGQINAGPTALSQSFVASSAGGLVRYQALTQAKSDAGVSLTATATSGAMGVSRTAGTNLDLVGEATSSSAKTDKAMFELNLADSYVAGAAVPITVNCNYTGSGTVTAASTTMTVNAYSEVNGVESALTVTAPSSIEIGSTAAPLVYSLSGSGLVPGSHIVVELVMLITSASGANTGQVNAVSLQD